MSLQNFKLNVANTVVNDDNANLVLHPEIKRKQPPVRGVPTAHGAVHSTGVMHSLCDARCTDAACAAMTCLLVCHALC
eukprot:2035838-Rhodomonas_salina.3